MKKQQIIVFGTGEIAELADFYFTHDSECEVVGFTVDGAYMKDAEFRGRPVLPFERGSASNFPRSAADCSSRVSYARLNAVRAEKGDRRAPGQGYPGWYPI